MSLAALKRDSARNEANAEADRLKRDHLFRQKIASQQFIKHNAALYRAWIVKGRRGDDAFRSSEFEAMGLDARTLAVRITQILFPTLEESAVMETARHFRVEASEAVASFWVDGRPLDIDSAARVIAGAADRANIVFDGETMRWRDISEAGSVTLSAAAASALLFRSVSIYDFRLGRSETLSRLSRILVEATSENVRAILPADASNEDRRSVFQTCMRENAILLSTIYEQIARRTVDAITGRPEADRRVWLVREQPLDAIERSFLDSASSFGQAAALVAQMALQALKAPGPEAPAPGK